MKFSVLSRFIWVVAFDLVMLCVLDSPRTSAQTSSIESRSSREAGRAFLTSSLAYLSVICLDGAVKKVEEQHGVTHD